MSNHDEPLAIIDQENPPPSNDQEETNQTTSKHNDSSSQTKSDCASQTNYGNVNVKDEAKPKQENNIHNNNTKRKRGPKPRSKRNRKKAKGGGVAVAISEKGDDENLAEKNAEVKVDILPLFHDNPARRERVRVVKPYFFTFATFVKARWVGKTVLDVYFNEFGSYPKVRFLRVVFVLFCFVCLVDLSHYLYSPFPPLNYKKIPPLFGIFRATMSLPSNPVESSLIRNV